MSGWDGTWPWRTGICWALDIPCWTLSAWLGGATMGCWEGAEAVGRWGGLIFSAISCSLILLIKTRLSSWQPENNICDKRTAISSASVTLWGEGSPYGLTHGIDPKTAFSQLRINSAFSLWFSLITGLLQSLINCSLDFMKENAQTAEKCRGNAFFADLRFIVGFLRKP